MIAAVEAVVVVAFWALAAPGLVLLVLGGAWIAAAVWTGERLERLFRRFH